MIHYRKIMAAILITAMVSFSSCGENKSTTTTEEQKEITTMDSTSKVVSQHKAELEAQTKKVEESLEKLDSEFDNNSKTK